MAKIISAKRALTPAGWQDDVSIHISSDGIISDITSGKEGGAKQVGILLPALSNVHSHSFQRAMAGLAERRGPNAFDDFWSWRQVMYCFLELLTPEDIENIAALVQMEMLEAGYSAQAEFHYVHHAPGGVHYDSIAETSARHIEAAKLTGIGYTHLPVLYMQGGLDGRALKGGQKRFGCDIDTFSTIFDACKNHIKDAPNDFKLGVAPHSLRAVSREGLEAAIALPRGGPIHIHAAEQIKEIEEVESALNARPVEWLLGEIPVNDNWCFIHATHMTETETTGLAKSGAVAGLCPLTEANLGDGIFNGDTFLGAGGHIGIGSDSNIRIAIAEELRTLETTQRLRDLRRNILTTEDVPSTGRYIYENAAEGGAQALARNSGEIRVGALADLTALDDSHIALTGLEGDAILDTWLFANGDDVVCDVWAAGRHIVSGGQHIKRGDIIENYRRTITRLRAAL